MPNTSMITHSTAKPPLISMPDPELNSWKTNPPQ